MLVFPFLLLLLLPLSAWAAPTVSGVSGTVANGQSVTITGSSFGSSGPTVVVFDDYETGTNTNNIKTGSGSSTVGQWAGLDFGGIAPKYSNSGCYAGSLCQRSDLTAHWTSAVLANVGTNATDVFVSYWSKIPSTDTIPQDSDLPNWKPIWLYSGDSNSDAIVLPVYEGTAQNSFNIWAVACNGCPFSSANIFFSPHDWTKGNWKHYAAYVHGSSSSSGHVDIWEWATTGVIHQVNTNQATLSGSGWSTVAVQGYGRQTSNCHPMFDDVYIAKGANALARIEITNASTYANSTAVAKVIPTSWSATSITATVYQGAFNSSDTAYLYVFDNTGTPNTSGFQVTIGSGSAQLNAPTSLTVNP